VTRVELGSCPGRGRPAWRHVGGAIRRLECVRAGRPPGDKFHVYTIITDDDLRLDLDGSLLASDTSTFDNPTGTGYTVGGNVNSNARHYLGHIAEIIILNRILSPSEINAVGLYLGGKYGIDTAYYVPEPGTLLIWALLAGLGIGMGWCRKR